MWTLLHLKFQKHIFAENGESGGRQQSTGADGEDVIVQVPLGTIARRAETGEVLFEITANGEEKILAKEKYDIQMKEKSLREKYNPDNIFKTKKVEDRQTFEETAQETALVEYKEQNFFQKVLDIIMNFFKRKK